MTITTTTTDLIEMNEILDIQEIKESRFPVVELFGPTIQGEGLMSGTISHFLRFGGCTYRCTWCDSMHAVEPKQVKANARKLTIGEIANEVSTLGLAPYVTFTGGDPCMWKGLEPLINTLNIRGYQVAIETQGVLFPDWLSKADVVTFSPKPPSSGNVTDIVPILNWIKAHTSDDFKRQFKVCIKIVVADSADWQYALNVYNTMSPIYYDAFYFTALTQLTAPEVTGNISIDVLTTNLRTEYVLAHYRQLANNVLRSGIFNTKTHVGCQLHTLLWPTEDKGV